MSARQSVTDAGMKALNRVHRAVLHASGGRVLGRISGMPIVELHTVGRTSGRPVSTVLGAPVVDGEQVVLVASKGGDDRDPDWYKNLVATPQVELTMAGRRRRMRARTATPDERAALWPRVTATYKAYDGYQRRTRRPIPVVVLEPVAD